jgi:hypothetical protein
MVEVAVVTGAALLPRGPLHMLYSAYRLPERGVDDHAPMAMLPSSAARLRGAPG